MQHICTHVCKNQNDKAEISEQQQNRPLFTQLEHDVILIVSDVMWKRDNALSSKEKKHLFK